MLFLAVSHVFLPGIWLVYCTFTVSSLLLTHVHVEECFNIEFTSKSLKAQNRIHWTEIIVINLLNKHT